MFCLFYVWLGVRFPHNLSCRVSSVCCSVLPGVFKFRCLLCQCFSPVVVYGVVVCFCSRLRPRPCMYCLMNGLNSTQSQDTKDLTDPRQNTWLLSPLLKRYTPFTAIIALWVNRTLSLRLSTSILMYHVSYDSVLFTEGNVGVAPLHFRPNIRARLKVEPMD